MDLSPRRTASDQAGIPKASMVVAALSAVVEWYDFTLYLFMTTVIARVFFGEGAASVLTTLALFAIAYLMRPLGALFFGHIGDRYGRRTVLLASMAVMAVAMLETALLPTHAQIGSGAGALLLALRCLMGFSVGGEYGGITAYLLEGAPPRRRGLVVSLAAAAGEIGALLAVAVAAVTTSLFGGDALDTWGWRLPFLFGALLAVATLAARSMMRESPAFEQEKRARVDRRAPLWLMLRTQRPGLYRTFAISALASITYYVGITYAPTYLSSVGGFAERDSLWLSTIAVAVVIVVTPFAGALSDRVGRRFALLLFGVLSLALPVAMFAFMADPTVLRAVTGTVVLAMLAGSISAVSTAATAEQFPVAVRLSGLAVGATAATAVFGGLTPYLAQAMTHASGWAPAPGVLVAVVAVVILPVLWWMPETAPVRGVAAYGGVRRMSAAVRSAR
ncbi:MFS transporter [Nonomuraea sp. NPDC049141]|uniref:MFS transporter n=1 Tax=Nonomuraea sp. NPDC049141 TaxID=3155500 RepID=UPI0033EA509E